MEGGHVALTSATAHGAHQLARGSGVEEDESTRRTRIVLGAHQPTRRRDAPAMLSSAVAHASHYPTRPFDQVAISHCAPQSASPSMHLTSTRRGVRCSRCTPTPTAVCRGALHERHTAHMLSFV